MTTVGVDVGKATLDVAVDGVPRIIQVPNIAAGIRKLVQRQRAVRCTASDVHSIAVPGARWARIAHRLSTCRVAAVDLTQAAVPDETKPITVLAHMAV